MNIGKEKACENCWETFISNGGKRYCSDKCKKEAALKRTSKKQVIRWNKQEIDKTRYLKLRFSVLQRDEFCCQYCGRDAKDGAKLHVDHIEPISLGGRAIPDSLITACSECNIGKGSSLLTIHQISKIKRLKQNDIVL